MYIVKNALRSISRSKGRSILIGIIIFVISLSSCLALSIRQAAKSEETAALSDLEVTASISVDRQALMGNFEDREGRREALSQNQELSLQELETYAQADSVKSFYYTYSASMNGENAEAIDSTGLASIGDEEAASSMEKGNDRMQGGPMGVQGDFTVIGYSSDEAMTAFLQGTQSISEGAMFAQGEADYTCVINEELASYNDLSVGDTIVLSNPNAEDETYTLTISGIYQSESSTDAAMNMMSGFMASADPANQIYISAQTAESIAEASSAAAVETTDETTGMTSTSALQMMLNGTYTFADVEAYESFEQEARDLGLSDEYTISSSDLNAYEQSLAPLQNLSRYAGYFLIVILVIGGSILIVLNIFSIRERKYEIGVLSAIGMKKKKIAAQFLIELSCITFCALLIGAGIGAVASVPLTNTLLSSQIENTAQNSMDRNDRFGREVGGFESFDEGQMMQPPEEMEQPQDQNMSFPMMNYVESVSSATNLTVIMQLIAIGLFLTIVSGITAIVFILRYDPLKILSDRE